MSLPEKRARTAQRAVPTKAMPNLKKRSRSDERLP